MAEISTLERFFKLLNGDQFPDNEELMELRVSWYTLYSVIKTHSHSFNSGLHSMRSISTNMHNGEFTLTIGQNIVKLMVSMQILLNSQNMCDVMEEYLALSNLKKSLILYAKTSKNVEFKKMVLSACKSNFTKV